MAEIGAADFKARCLEIMDRVAEKRESYTITKRGRPVARLLPVERRNARTVFGCMAHETKVSERLDAPLWTEKQWKEFQERSAAQIAEPKRSKR